jgi:cytochrome b6-f complex iron-sulfur subunit
MALSAAFTAVAALAVVAMLVMRGATPRPVRFDHVARRRDQQSSRAARGRGVRRTAARDRPPNPTTPARRERAVVPRGADEETIGVTRWSFLNRSLLAAAVLGTAAFGSAVLGFLWPSPAKGFGSKITVGTTADAAAAFVAKQPFYNATAKTYVVAYPKAALARAKRIPAYTPPILAGMAAGYVALYQTCPHLGCRVPWCQSSQWFECPCHGSKYNAVGEKQGGPAPRGMDRFVFELSGDNIVVDTGNLVLGPPIGTDTTGQAPAGPPCV